MKKLESAKKSLRTAENRHESHMHVIRDLENQLAEIEQKRKEFDNQVCIFRNLAFNLMIF